MKVLMINGSIHEHGCTFTALSIIKEQLAKNEIDSEIIWIGDKAINDFSENNEEHDIVDEIGEKMKESDGLIVGSPTWYSHPTGRLLCVLDRLSSKYKNDLAFKPASSIMTARRGGQVMSNDIIQKHFSINNMPIITSTYWNLVFGSNPEEVLKDEEGVATMINLANNMSWILHSLDIAKLEHPNPLRKKTNFHR